MPFTNTCAPAQRIDNAISRVLQIVCLPFLPCVTADEDTHAFGHPVPSRLSGSSTSARRRGHIKRASHHAEKRPRLQDAAGSLASAASCSRPSPQRSHPCGISHEAAASPFPAPIDQLADYSVDLQTDFNFPADPTATLLITLIGTNAAVGPLCLCKDRGPAVPQQTGSPATYMVLGEPDVGFLLEVCYKELQIVGPAPSAVLDPSQHSNILQDTRSCQHEI